MEYKIVFFDIDGTITSEIDGKIPTSTKKAIKSLINQGIKVVAATGRPYTMCSELLDIGIETFITANGAYVKHKDSIIYSFKMKKEIIFELSSFALKHNKGLGYFTEEYTMNGTKSEEISNALKETLSLDTYPKTDKFICEQDVYGVCLYANEEETQPFIKEFPQLSFKRWHPFVLDVLEDEVSKSSAIIKVLEYFNIDKSEAIAFGDGGNDIDMIELVGLGIAMGNARERLKEKADFVTKNSSEGGIEYALKNFKII